VDKAEKVYLPYKKTTRHVSEWFATAVAMMN